MTIRTALVGFGLGGRIFHAPFLAADPDFTIAAIVTSDPERAAVARNEHPEARIIPDLDTPPPPDPAAAASSPPPRCCCCCSSSCRRHQVASSRFIASRSSLSEDPGNPENLASVMSGYRIHQVPTASRNATPVFQNVASWHST